MTTQPHRAPAALVPNVFNKEQSRAERILGEAGFRVRTKAIPIHGLRGIVLDQHPIANVRLKQGGTVTIKVGSLSVKAKNCDSKLEWGGALGAAAGVQVEGVDCESAQTLIDDAHATEPCRKGDRCQVDGYSCNQEVAATEALTVTCVKGADKVGWTWGGA